MKKFLTVVFSLFLSFSLFAQSSDVANNLNSIRTTYVRPILIALIMIMAIVGGIANMPEIRRGGEEAKKAMLSWGMMVIWPTIVWGIAEVAGVFLR